MKIIYTFLFCVISLSSNRAQEIGEPACYYDLILYERTPIQLPITHQEFDSLLINDIPFILPFEHPLVKSYMKYGFADSLYQNRTDTIELWTDWFLGFTCQYYRFDKIVESWTYLDTDWNRFNPPSYILKRHHPNGKIRSIGSSEDFRNWNVFDTSGKYIKTVKEDRVYQPLKNYSSEGIKLMRSSVKKVYQPLKEIDTIEFHYFPDSYFDTIPFLSYNIERKIKTEVIDEIEHIEYGSTEYTYYIDHKKVSQKTYQKARELYPEAWYDLSENCVPCWRREYYESGQLESEGLGYTDCSFGKWVYYYESGVIKKITYHTENTNNDWINIPCGQETGTWQFFNEEGNLIKEQTYSNGKLIDEVLFE
ncbi:MAG: hypothetical protein H6598_03305 [Flavobacteriales bacterium]|nr:hypothetical protein [Flavobacteriales bacterium]